MDQEPGSTIPMSDRTSANNKDVTVLASGASVSLIGKVLGRGIHILGQIVLARYLGPRVFGLYAIGWTILRVIGVISPLGLHNGVIRFASAYWKRDDSRLKSVLMQSIGIGISFGVLISLIEVIVAPRIALAYQMDDLKEVLRWFALAIPFLTGLTISSAATRVTQRMKYAVFAEDVGQPVVGLFLIGIVYLVGGWLKGAIIAEILSLAIALFIATYFLRKLYTKELAVDVVEHQSTKELILFSVPTILTGMFSMLIIWTARLAIGFYRPAEDVGVYQAVSQSSTIFAIILGGFNAMFSPMIARLYHQGETTRLNALFKVSTKWGLYLSLPIFLTIFFASKELVFVIFGPEYIQGSLSLIILAIGQLVNVGTGAVAIMLIMSGHQNDWLVISCIAWLINLILNIALIPSFGMIGSAIATSAAVSILFLVGLIRVRGKLKMWPYDRRYFKGLVATINTSIILGLIKLLGIEVYALQLVIVLITSYFIFVLSILILGLDNEDKEYIDVVRHRLGLLRGTLSPE